MATAQELLRLAESQIGIKESPAGSNRVKYNTEYYGSEVSGKAYPWCCVFQWWLFRHADASALFYGGSKTAYCAELYRHYRKNGQAVKLHEIIPGDLIFFNFSDRPGAISHIGICEKTEPGYIITIDGNTGTDSESNGGAVMRRRRAMRYVTAAARPAYDTASAGVPSPVDAEHKLYHFVEEMPAYYQEAATKAILLGIMKMDRTGAVTTTETGLQVLTWLDRLGLLTQAGQKGA